MKRGLWCATGALAFACTACGNSRGLYPVSGTVTYRGEPAVGATVFLHRAGADPLNEQTHLGVVREDGTFTIDSGALGQGRAGRRLCRPDPVEACPCRGPGRPPGTSARPPEWALF